MQEELEWWSEAGSLAGLSLTSPLSLSHTSPLSLSRTDQIPQGGREGFSLPPASSLSSLSYLQYPSPVSQPNPSKYPPGAASSSSTSTGMYLKFRYRYRYLKYEYLKYPYNTCTSNTSTSGTCTGPQIGVPQVQVQVPQVKVQVHVLLHPPSQPDLHHRCLLLPLLPTSLTILATTLAGLVQPQQKHKSLLASRQLPGDIDGYYGITKPTQDLPQIIILPPAASARHWLLHSRPRGR